jgi:hypothetical protein
MNGLQSRLRLTALLGLAALAIIIIYSIAPKATAITNEASTELYGIDILGLTGNAKDLPAEHYPAH